jgi:hypothetical protein
MTDRFIGRQANTMDSIYAKSSAQKVTQVNGNYSSDS